MWFPLFLADWFGIRRAIPAYAVAERAPRIGGEILGIGVD